VEAIERGQQVAVECKVVFSIQRQRLIVELDVQEFAVVSALWIALVGWAEVEKDG
jgi:hypothetical protein